MSAGVGGCVLLLIRTQHKHAAFTHTLRMPTAAETEGRAVWIFEGSLYWSWAWCWIWNKLNGSVYIPTMGNWALHSDSELNAEAVFHLVRKPPLLHLPMWLIEMWLCIQNPEVWATIFTQSSNCVPVCLQTHQHAQWRATKRINTRGSAALWPLLEKTIRHGSLYALS